VRTDGSRSSWQEVKKMAQEAERIGCDSVWLADRLQVDDVGVWESTTMVAAIAAVTEKVTIGTAVTRSIYRNPALLAKVVDSIDEISAGRFILGLGAGSNEGDHAQFGYPTDHPVSRFEEALHITHALLRTGRITHSGAYYQAEEAILQPRGPSPNGPPIAIAATGPRMMRLAAKYADYWNCLDLPTTPEGLQPHIDAMEAACVAENRDPKTLKRIAVLLLANTPGIPHPYGDAVSGDPEQIAERIQRFFDYGYGDVIVYPSPDKSEAITALEPVIEALKN
jgi:alkanesulfonate monooxygenase SsuD/methylene tetrahydromethanopterin reductase-like flavin-dependent oxidoreductase (luciferase family)